MTQHEEECKSANSSVSAAAAIYPITQRLDLGDHEEIATRTKFALQSVHGLMVHAEGEFYHFDKVWKPLPEGVVERVVARHSGIMNTDGEALRITAPTVASVTKLVRNKMSDEAFFEATPRQGIATRSGLIVFDAAPKVIPHAREHRRRFVIAADWPVAVSGPGLFARALQTAFKGDPEADDKVTVLQELFGALALGLAPWELEQAKAGLLNGPQNGGKSTLLELAAVLIPPEAVCSLNPAVFANRIECTYSLPVLAGKQLNISEPES